MPRAPTGVFGKAHSPWHQPLEARSELQEPEEDKDTLMKNLFANLCLLLGSCVAGLALCEVSLRLFYPQYSYLAEARFQRDERRL